MNKAEAGRRYGRYRQTLYANLTDTKSDLDYMKRSPLLSIKEKELLQKAIDSLEEVRLEMNAARNKAIITAKQLPAKDDTTERQY